MKSFYVYILTNHSHSTLYIGVTNDISRRTFEHKTKLNHGFAEKYNTYKLIYTEEYSLHTDAIAREKQLKKWRRDKKIRLISSTNPDWHNLFNEL